MLPQAVWLFLFSRRCSPLHLSGCRKKRLMNFDKHPITTGMWGQRARLLRFTRTLKREEPHILPLVIIFRSGFDTSCAPVSHYLFLTFSVAGTLFAIFVMIFFYSILIFSIWLIVFEGIDSLEKKKSEQILLSRLVTKVIFFHFFSFFSPHVHPFRLMLPIEHRVSFLQSFLEPPASLSAPDNCSYQNTSNSHFSTLCSISISEAEIYYTQFNLRRSRLRGS